MTRDDVLGLLRCAGAVVALAAVLGACAGDNGDGHHGDDGDDDGGVVDVHARIVQDFGAFTRADLAPFLAAGVHIDNGYRVLTIEYDTDGRSGTATLTLPIDDDAPPAAGYPVVVNAHGTVGLDDPCRLSNTISGSGLAGLFGARRAVGVAPDYPGLGTAGLQDYLSTRSEGTSVLDAIRAAQQVAAQEGVDENGRAAVVGLSQGGHAVLAAASLQASYAPELDVRAYGACAPADVYEEHWAPAIQVTGPHMPNLALAIWSWAQQEGAGDDGLFADDVAAGIDELMRTRCMWSPSFTNEPTLGDALSEDASAVFTPELIDDFAHGTSGGRFAFVHAFFDENRVRPFEQTAPIRIWQGTADTTVLPFQTEALVADLVAAGMDVELTHVDGGTHIDTAFGFVAAAEHATDESIAWVQAQLAAP